MRIQHNIAALNSYRQLGGNNNALSKNLEKLSSGYRINRAGDDAAGLAISEKMRAQIKGLEAAQKNANDGISLVQTAEGALTEVHSMLNRMTYLATQSANGTYDDGVDRQNLQKEVDSLLAEIDRIAESTNYNSINLLDGSLAAEKPVVTPDVPEVPEMAPAEGKQVMAEASNAAVTFTSTAATQSSWVSGQAFTASTNGGKADITINYKDANGVDHELELKGVTIAASDAGTNILSALNGNEEFSALFEASKNGSSNLVIKSKESGANVAQVTSATVAYDTAAATGATAITSGTATAGADASMVMEFTATPTAGDTVTLGDKTFEFVANAGDAVKTEGAIAVVISSGTGDVKDNGGAGSVLSGSGALLDKEKTVANLVAAMKANGFANAEAGTKSTVDSASNPGSTSVTGANAHKITFKDMSELEVDQKGAQITATDDAFKVVGKDETKSEATFDLGTTSSGGGTDETFTVEYVDQKGQLQKAEVIYKSSAVDTDNANAIMAELKKDEALTAVFDISVDSADKLVLKAKDGGTDGGRVVAMKTTDAAQTGVSAVINAAEDSSKTLEFADFNLLKAGDTVTINGKTYEFVTGDNSAVKGEGNTAVTIGTDVQTMQNLANALRQDGLDVTFDATAKTIKFDDNAELPAPEVEEAPPAEPGKGLTLQIGDTADGFNQLTVTVGNMNAESLGIADVDISTQEGAKLAVDKIKEAINKVSSTRGDLGAVQNRLEHTINNLGVTAENLTAAESRIRDTDMADEMMAYTKNNILVQAAQAMLAQANQVPQGVLQLLQ